MARLVASRVVTRLRGATKVRSNAAAGTFCSRLTYLDQRRGNLPPLPWLDALASRRSGYLGLHDHRSPNPAM